MAENLVIKHVQVTDGSNSTLYDIGTTGKNVSDVKDKNTDSLKPLLENELSYKAYGGLFQADDSENVAQVKFEVGKEGEDTQTILAGARINGALATGTNTIATGKNSVAIGEGTIATSDNQVVIGQYNTKEHISTTYKPFFEVGNGTNDSNREDAFWVGYITDPKWGEINPTTTKIPCISSDNSLWWLGRQYNDYSFTTDSTQTNFELECESYGAAINSGETKSTYSFRKITLDKGVVDIKRSGSVMTVKGFFSINSVYDFKNTTPTFNFKIKNKSNVKLPEFYFCSTASTQGNTQKLYVDDMLLLKENGDDILRCRICYNPASTEVNDEEVDTSTYVGNYDAKGLSIEVCTSKDIIGLWYFDTSFVLQPSV